MSEIRAVVPLRVLQGAPHPQTDDDAAQRTLVGLAFDLPDRLVCVLDNGDVAEFRGMRPQKLRHVNANVGNISQGIDFHDDYSTPVLWMPKSGPVIATGASLGDGWSEFVEGVLG